jgi:hypothetical protein
MATGNSIASQKQTTPNGDMEFSMQMLVRAYYQIKIVSNTKGTNESNTIIGFLLIDYVKCDEITQLK